ncbi:MAG TPA: hypothetical protein VG815_06930, partial [Chloroflexota bacterium]|nr:hypothetical protein [Chloroflexota bacterium]
MTAVALSRMTRPPSSRFGRRCIGPCALVVALTVILGSFPAVAASTAKAVRISGTVWYYKRGCYADTTRTLTPVPNAFVQLVRGTKSTTWPLNANGRFRASLSGTGSTYGYLLLNGPRLAVSPNSSGAKPYRIPLGWVKAGANAFKLSGNGPAGAANIWTVVSMGQNFAASVSPVRIPPLKVAWRENANLAAGSPFDGTDDTYFDGANNTLMVDGGGNRQDQWEPFVLLHEYGHLVLTTIETLPEFQADGDHT